jgi:hypothetical protein
MIEMVSAEEFSWQEAHYDQDSRQGRELLFLMANHEWVRATSEVTDITRSDAVETTIKVDIDFSQVTHEAFRKRTEPIWLPIAVLPPSKDHSRLEPDLFATVTDASGNQVLMQPVADLRHQVSAAMAEIIVKMAVSHLPKSANGQSAAGPGAAGESPVDTRDERLLLSAAIYQLLRDGSGRDSGARPGRVTAMPRTTRSRITTARNALALLLDPYIRQLEIRFGDETKAGTEREHKFAPELGRRAVKILQALAESIFIVVRADFPVQPSVLTIRVPPRRLMTSNSSWLQPWTWVIRPAGRLEIDVLLPTADADRQIQVNLPDGVSADCPDGKATRNGDACPILDISVHTPLPLQDLDASMKQVIDAQREAGKQAGRGPLVRSLRDLARANAALAGDTLRYYEASYKDQDAQRRAGPDEAVGDPSQKLADLVVALDRQDDEGPRPLDEPWGDFALSKLSLSRRVQLDVINPQTAVGRANMIEDVSQRATPKTAKISVGVTVDDRDYFSTARSSAVMTLILMCGVLCFLVFWPVVNPRASLPSPEVLAIVLTLFATIQADRIERPDRSTLRGQLFAMGSWLIGASVLPSLALALALGFQTRGLPAALWASGCILAQLLLLVLMKRGPLTPSGRPRLLKLRTFETTGPEYRHFEALRSDYWRNTTAEALMIGRMAYGYVVWQKADSKKRAESISPKLRPLVLWDKERPPTESSSVLALLRTGTLRQAVTFVVFRGQPASTWPQDQENGNSVDTLQCRNLGLDPGRLAPADIVTRRVDVFVGVPAGEILTTADHPVAIILEAAANKLVVLDIQLPVPPPAQGYAGRQWARIRLAVRDAEDIHRLSGFLADVYEQMAGERNARHVVAVQMAPAAVLRVISGPVASEANPEAGGMSEVDVLTTHLDIVNRYAFNEPSDARTWRVLAICGDARSNVESDIVRQLSAVRAGFQLAGLTYGLLHGTAVMVFFVHEPTVDQQGVKVGQVVQSDQEYAADLEAALRKEPDCAKLRVMVCKQLSRDDLEPAPADHSFPMLKVRFRWKDRPGAIVNVLESISQALAEALPAIPMQDWSVAYARVQVLTGQVAHGRMTIRIHVPPSQVEPWTSARMAEMARKIETMAASEATRRAALDRAAGDHGRPEEPVVTIERIKITS